MDRRSLLDNSEIRSSNLEQSISSDHCKIFLLEAILFWDSSHVIVSKCVVDLNIGTLSLRTRSLFEPNPNFVLLNSSFQNRNLNFVTII